MCTNLAFWDLLLATSFYLARIQGAQELRARLPTGGVASQAQLCAFKTGKCQGGSHVDADKGWGATK